MNMRQNLGNYGIDKNQIRQGGGRGSGNDHVEDMAGATELYVYQTPNKPVKGYEGLKLFLESEGCEVLYTTDVPPELRDYDAMRITGKNGEALSFAALKRAHSWAHQRNFLHSFFKPLYR